MNDSRPQREATPVRINVFRKHDSLCSEKKYYSASVDVLSFGAGISTSPHNENFLPFAHGNFRGRRGPPETSRRAKPAGTFTVGPRIRGWIARPFVSQLRFLSRSTPLTRPYEKASCVSSKRFYGGQLSRGWLTCTTAHCKSKPRTYRSSDQLTSFAASNVSCSRSKKKLIAFRKSAIK